MAVKIVVKEVTVFYRSIKALDGVSITFKDGSVTAILGPNGAGKTTLLRCLNGLLRPSVGTVFIDGYEVQSLKPREIAKKFGYVPQSTDPTLSFTVFEMVMMGRRPYVNWKLNEKDLEVINRALNMTGIKHLANRYFDELSGGEKQKVIIARALAQEPEVLLLDEPTSNLDLKHQLEILNLIRRLARERNITVIMAMHDINLACRFSDMAILLKDGKVYAFGEPEAIVTRSNIKEVYGVDVEIIQNPYPLIIPVEVRKY